MPDWVMTTGVIPAALISVRALSSPSCRESLVTIKISVLTPKSPARPKPRGVWVDRKAAPSHPLTTTPTATTTTTANAAASASTTATTAPTPTTTTTATPNTIPNSTES